MVNSRKIDNLYMGIDLGSTSTEAVVINDQGEIITFKMIDTYPNHKICIEQLLSLVFQELSKLYSSPITMEDIRFCVGTGYGRENIYCAKKTASEIACHAKGARYYFPDIRTIIDIGGQDSKVISINEKGEVADFTMNEKCAAGTGRFLEAVGGVCEVSLDDLGSTSLEAQTETTISSMCTVFAESEIISKLAQGEEKESIIKGVHSSIVFRVLSMGKRIGITPPLAFTGGVAHNIGIVRMLVEKTGFNVEDVGIPPHPQLIGALGAAFFALENDKKLHQTNSIHVASHNTSIGIIMELKKELPILTNGEVLKPVAGWTDMAVPLELISAAGIHHIRITGDLDKDSSSDRFIRTNLCAYIKNSISALFEKSDKYNFIDGIISTNCCSATERMYDVINSQSDIYVRETGNKPLFVYPITIPRKDTTEAVNYMKSSILELKGFLEEKYSRSITAEQLKDSCARYNMAKQLMKEYSGLLATKNIPNASRFISIQLDTLWSQGEVTTEFIKNTEHKINLLKEISPLEKTGPKILFAGSIIPDRTFYDIFDTVNCHIVYNNTSSGDKFSESLVDMEDEDIYTALAKRCLYNGYTPRSMNATSRMSKIKSLINKFDVEGIILNITKFCVYYTFEAVILKEYCQQWNIPLLVIETDFKSKSIGQLKTRIEAFIETFNK